MLEPRRINSNIAPTTTENLGNGNWYYNYDIKSEKVELPLKDGETVPREKIRYNYIQIKLSGKPEYKKCVELLIREFITQTQEFDLINSANKAILSGAKSSKDITKYREYLDKVEEIKEKVAKDFIK
nr:MAG TPA: hypothetical protein [Crassvirales sp.]